MTANGRVAMGIVLVATRMLLATGKIANCAAYATYQEHNFLAAAVKEDGDCDCELFNGGSLGSLRADWNRCKGDVSPNYAPFSSDYLATPLYKNNGLEGLGCGAVLNCKEPAGWKPYEDCPVKINNLAGCDTEWCVGVSKQEKDNDIVDESACMACDEGYKLGGVVQDTYKYYERTISNLCVREGDDAASDGFHFYPNTAYCPVDYPIEDGIHPTSAAVCNSLLTNHDSNVLTKWCKKEEPTTMQTRHGTACFKITTPSSTTTTTTTTTTATTKATPTTTKTTTSSTTSSTLAAATTNTDVTSFGADGFSPVAVNSTATTATITATTEDDYSENVLAGGGGTPAAASEDGSDDVNANSSSNKESKMGGSMIAVIIMAALAVIGIVVGILKWRSGGGDPQPLRPNAQFNNRMYDTGVDGDGGGGGGGGGHQARALSTPATSTLYAIPMENEDGSAGPATGVAANGGKGSIPSTTAPAVEAGQVMYVSALNSNDPAYTAADVSALYTVVSKPKGGSASTDDDDNGRYSGYAPPPGSLGVEYATPVADGSGERFYDLAMQDNIVNHYDLPAPGERRRGRKGTQNHQSEA